MARQIGSAKRVLVASPVLLDRIGHPNSPQGLAKVDTISHPGESQDGRARWVIGAADGQGLAEEESAKIVSIHVGYYLIVS